MDGASSTRLEPRVDFLGLLPLSLAAPGPGRCGLVSTNSVEPSVASAATVHHVNEADNSRFFAVKRACQPPVRRGLSGTVVVRGAVEKALTFHGPYCITRGELRDGPALSWRRLDRAGAPPQAARLDPARVIVRVGALCHLCIAIVVSASNPQGGRELSDAPQQQQSSRAALTLLAFGVVFGDIGTSPLYAVKETFSPVHGIALTADNVLGGLSTIFWALMIVVSLKYVTAHHARRQPRGGRDHGAARARLGLHQVAPRVARAVARRGRDRRRALLWRRGADPRDLGALGGRGAGSRHFRIQALRVADCGGRAGCAVPDPAQGHRGGGYVVRSGHRAVVPRARRGRHLRHRAVPAGAVGVKSVACVPFFHEPHPGLVRGAGLGGARRHRRGGALRGHGPLRQGADPARLVRAGGAGAGAQLFRAGRAAASSSRRRSGTRSTSWCRAGRSTRWSRSPPRRQ